MPEYTIKGTIITQPNDKDSIKIGNIAIIKINNKFHRIVIMHSFDDELIVAGDYFGPIPKDSLFFRLSLLTPSHCYPIAFTDWKDIIKHDLIGFEQQTFLIKPKTFKKGNITQTCNHCNVSFFAAKDQTLCKKCCDKLAIAYLHGDSKERTEERKYTRTFVEKIAEDSYTVGEAHFNKEEFYKFLKKELDGNNTDQKKN